MKCQKLIAIIVLGILTCMPSTVFSRSTRDSLVLNRIFTYTRNYTPNSVYGLSTNVYTKTNINVWKRNSLLWLIPSMYSIADGDRYLVSEAYSKLRFKEINDYESQRKACFSTIRHNRRALPTVVEFMTPAIYNSCLYNDHILSPFNKHNRRYYRYKVLTSINGMVIVEFKPALPDNTQLISGEAYVDEATGRVVKATINGEFDMIRFHTEATLGDEGASSLLPKECKTNVVFKFVGNEIYSTFDAVYDCPINLPDSIDDEFSIELMDSIRPIPLTAQERHVFDEYLEEHKPDTTETRDSVVHKFNFFKDVMQDAIGDNLISSIRYDNAYAHMKLSPILNPQYISYSGTHGLAYKMKLGSYYKFNEHRYIEFYPWWGYNFKYKKFYFTLPLSFFYNPKRNGQLQVTYGNGNRISNGYVRSEIEREFGDTLDLDNKQLDYFDDYYLTVTNNIMAFNWLEVETGFTYHRRVPYNRSMMEQFGKQKTYNSFSPMVTLKLRPWRKGPLLTVDYEQGIKGLFNSDLDYMRWEFDCSKKYDIQPLRKLNIKLGAGFYSRKNDDIFVDYKHFRDNKLPEGWDDDWTGDFQMLESQLYNDSRYYLRGNISYESPFLITSWLPLIGRFIEKERFYISNLGIDNTRTYSEFGYGVTTRLLSIGIFTSLLNSEFKGVEAKFTFELFNRW